ncbi:MAG TPA: ribonuclease E inhibitor RraB [Planctomycetota bacterium]|nr:ribonuclease E inhibitor RraB [Planctomycetota bacterium]
MSTPTLPVGWHLYFSMRDDAVRSVLVDLGAGVDQNSDLKWLTIVRITLCAPFHGLAVGQEEQVLVAMHLRLEEILQSLKPGLLDRLFRRQTAARFQSVGRETGAGFRRLFIYGTEPIPQWIYQKLGAEFNSHSIESAEIEDPKWTQYWSELHPRSATTALLLSDAEVKLREESGDQTNVERLVDHELSFPDNESRKKFINKVTKEEWNVERTFEVTKDGVKSYLVALTRMQRVDKMWADISIVALTSRAEPFGGKYVGGGAFEIHKDPK